MFGHVNSKGPGETLFFGWMLDVGDYAAYRRHFNFAELPDILEDKEAFFLFLIFRTLL